MPKKGETEAMSKKILEVLKPIRQTKRGAYVIGIMGPGAGDDYTVLTMEGSSYNIATLLVTLMSTLKESYEDTEEEPKNVPC